MAQRIILALMATCLMAWSSQVLADNITTVAGNGSNGFSGEGGPALSASLSPWDVAVDRAGNLYLTANHRILKIDGSGTLSTIAGNGTPSFSGDGGLATSAGLNNPSGVWVDGGGNVYIADTFNHRVRRVDAAGNITTLAGTGTPSFSGDGGPATSAALNTPRSVVLDALGNLYIADQANGCVRKVDTGGTISTLASGLLDPYGLSVAGNALYVALLGNHQILEVDLGSGAVTTVAGSTEGWGGDGGPATAANLDHPTDVFATSSGYLFIADFFNNRVRMVDPGGTITTVAGSGNIGPGMGSFSGDGGPATDATLSMPSGVALDEEGCLYIADSLNRRVRRTCGFGAPPPPPPDLTPPTLVLIGDPVITFSAGPSAAYSEPGWMVSDDTDPNPTVTVDLGGLDPDNPTPGTYTLTYIASDASGNSSEPAYRTVIVEPPPPPPDIEPPMPCLADWPGQGPADNITTVAGNGSNGFSGEGGPALSASLNPWDVAVDGVGNFYFTANHRILKVDGNGLLTAVAGNGNAGFSSDNGPATLASLNNPSGVYVEGGAIYIADTFNHRVRKVGADGNITTLAGNGTPSLSGDGGPATSAALNTPRSVVLDALGNLYIADQANGRIRKVDTGSTISTLASGLLDPYGLSVAGNALYVALLGSTQILKVDLDNGAVTTVAGSTEGWGGDGGPATAANLDHPTDVFAAPTGHLFIADFFNNRVRMVDLDGRIFTVAGDGATGPGMGGFSGDGGPATDATLNMPSGVALDQEGCLYIADSANKRVRRTCGFCTLPPPPDTAPPTLVLQGEATITFSAGPSAAYSEPGWMVSDDTDPNPTVTVDLGGLDPDNPTPGTYTLTYIASDLAGNSATVTRTVIVEPPPPPSDTTPPTLTLNGANPLLLELGTPYTEPGWTASDDTDPNPTVTVDLGGLDPDNPTPGTYTLTYIASDLAGNSTSVFRTIQVLVTPNSYGLIATHSMHLRNSARILSGFAGVVEHGQAPFLAGKVELVVGTRVQTGEEVRLSAPRVRVRQQANIEAELVYNQLVSVGKRATIAEQTQVPASYFPLFQETGLPTFLTAAPGTQDVEVRQRGSATLAAGAYDEVRVRQKGTLIFSGGTYHLGDLGVGQNTQVLFSAPTTLLIRGQLSLDQGSSFGPASGSGIDASEILVYVEGRNGRLGPHHDDDEGDDEEDDEEGRRLRRSPRAAKIGVQVSFQGNLYAPNGTLHLRQGSACVGSFIARDIIVGVRAQVAAHSGWNTPGVIYQPQAPAPLAKLAAAQGEAAVLPNNTGLLANYPNPFNPATTVPYALAEAGLVRLSIYNVLGQEVRVLVDQLQVPGSYAVSWDGRDNQGQALGSGVYFYRLSAGGFVQTRRLLLVR